MAASKELQLIAKIADVGELRPVIDAGITVDKFADQDARLVFEYISRYHHSRKTVGNVPTRELIAENFPSVDLPPVDRLTLSSAIEEFLNHDIKSRLNKLTDFMSEWGDTPEKVLPHAYAEISDMQRDKRTSIDIVVSDSTLDIKRRYEDAKNRDVLKGIPYPWKILNDETQGMQDGQFIIFYGRPKSEKTFLGIKVSTHAYDYANRRVLIYTREMSPDQMMDRTICTLIHAPYDAFRKGYLHELPHPYGGTMEDAFYSYVDTLKTNEETVALEGKRKTIIITSDREDRKGGGVNGLRRKIEDHKPDLVFVDAVYLMRNDRNGTRSVKWSDQAAVSQDLKDLAQDFNRPLIATLQANRGSEMHKGESAANMSFSDSYAQDCDLAIEIIKKRIDDSNNELALAITASREVNLAGFAIHGNPCDNFDILMKPVTDKYGVPLKENGEALVEPVIFHDLPDIWKMFKREEEDASKGPTAEQLRTMMGGDQKKKKKKNSNAT